MGLTDRTTLSIMVAAAKIGVSRRTIYNWIAAGRVNYCRTPGGSIRLFEDELLTLQQRSEYDRIHQKPLPKRDTGPFLS